MASRKAIHLALRTQLATVAGLPTVALENREFTPTTGTPYVEEEFVPAARSVRTLLPGGTVETLGLYVVKWYGIAKTGLDAINTGVEAILDAFQPGSALATSDGATVRIRTLPAPYYGQILPSDNGFAVCTVTVPWRIDGPIS